MIKKYSKLFALTFLAFFISMVTTNAKQLTAQELGTEILKTQPNAGHVYVIGSYAFTSEYAFKYDIKDIMLASADSINDVAVANGASKADLEDLSETMTIYEIKRVSETDWELTGNVVGNGTALAGNAAIEIKFIDYEYVREDEEVDTDTMVSDAFTGSGSKVNADMFMVDASDLANGNLRVQVDDTESSIVVGMQSGAVAALRDLLEKNAEIESITFAYPGVEPFTFTRDTLDVEILLWVENNLSKIFGTDATTAKLIGKSFTATLNLAHTDTLNYVAEKNDAKSVEYTITFAGEINKVDVDEVLTEAFTGTDSKVNTDMFTVNASDLASGKLEVEVTDFESSIIIGMQSGVISALRDLLDNNESIESITFTYPDVPGVEEFVFKRDTTIQEILKWMTDNQSKIFGNFTTTAGLVGKSFTATLNLSQTDTTIYVSEKDGATSVKYTISFIGDVVAVDTDTMLSEAFTGENNKINEEMFAADLSGLEDGKVGVTVKDFESSIIIGMQSGVITALTDLLDNNASIESITFAYPAVPGVENFTFTRETTLEEITGWVTRNLATIFEGNATTAGLVGKSFTATLNLAQTENYVNQNGETSVEYTISFTE